MSDGAEKGARCNQGQHFLSEVAGDGLATLSLLFLRRNESVQDSDRSDTYCKS